MPSLADLFEKIRQRNVDTYGGSSWWGDFQAASAGGKDALAEWMNTKAPHYHDWSRDAAEFASRTLAQEQEHTRMLFGISVSKNTSDKIGHIAGIGGKIGAATAVVMGAYAAGAAAIGGEAAAGGGTAAAAGVDASTGLYAGESAYAGAATYGTVGGAATGAGASSSFGAALQAAGEKLATSVGTSLAVRALSPQSHPPAATPSSTSTPAAMMLRPTVNSHDGAGVGVGIGAGDAQTLFLLLSAAVLIAALTLSITGR